MSGAGLDFQILARIASESIITRQADTIQHLKSLLADPNFQIETDGYESLVLAIHNGVPDKVIDLSPETDGDAR